MKNEKTSTTSKSKSVKTSTINGNGSKQGLNTGQKGATGATGKIKPQAGRALHDEETNISYEDDQRGVHKE